MFDQVRSAKTRWWTRDESAWVSVLEDLATAAEAGRSIDR